MKEPLWIYSGVGSVIVMASFMACSEVQPVSSGPGSYAQPSALPVAPFFLSEPNEAKAYRALAREQDTQLGLCAHERTCDQVHFSRALLALFDNQRLAAKHFQDVITMAPKSRLAAASTDWLKLLQDSPPLSERQGHLAKVTQGLIIELVSREQVAKEELTVREKRLEELSTQIESLKLIDQEMNERTHRLRPRTRGYQGPPEATETSK